MDVTAEWPAADPVVATLEQSAEAAADEDTPTAEVDVAQAKEDQSLADAIANEARKGFDFLVIGVDPATSPKGGFDARVSQIACAFSGPVAVVAARGPHERDPQNAPLDLLVPVTGNNIPLRLGTAPPVLPNVRGPKIISEDFGLQKKFSFNETTGFELRADFFNAFNRAGRGDPITEITDPLFGKIVGSRFGPRNIQVSARFNF